MKALIFSTFGNPEVLEYTDVPDPVFKYRRIIGTDESQWFKLCRCMSLQTRKNKRSNELQQAK